MHLFVSPVKSLLRRYDIFLKSHISNPFNVNKPNYYQVSKLNTCQWYTLSSFRTPFWTISVNPVTCLNPVIAGDVIKHCVGASTASRYFHKPGNLKSLKQVASTFKAFIRKVIHYPPQAANLTVVNTELQHKVWNAFSCIVFCQVTRFQYYLFGKYYFYKTWCHSIHKIHFLLSFRRSFYIQNFYFCVT